MPRIKQSSIDAVRQRVSLLDVAQQYAQMKRAGSQWRGLSPFSPEKTPSFFVHPDKNVFMDYSSGFAGDLFRFVELKENLSFTEAVETLARRYNVPLEFEEGGSPQQASVRKELFDIHEEAVDYFRKCFEAEHAESAQMRDYWTQGRGFSLEVAADYGIGYAPANGGKLFELMRAKQFSDEALRVCGLFYIRDNDLNLERARCRFRGRLMIPIRDVQGRVVAFTARKTELTPEDDPSREAKYVNSPETPIFVKSRVLFNLDRARKAIDEAGSFVLVEGQLDAIRCWSEGVTAAVAPQGTAITDEQLALLKRYSPTVEVLLDGDDAGQRAAFRMLPKALKAGLDVSFLPLEPGMDPDDLLKTEGAGALESLRAKCLSAMELAVRTVLPEPESVSPQQKAVALGQLYAIVGVAESAVVRDAYLMEIAKQLRVNPESLMRDAAKALRTQAPVAFSSPSRRPEQAVETPPQQTETKVVTVEEETLIVGFNYSYLFSQVLQFIDPSWVDTSQPCGVLLRQMLYEYSEGVWDGAEDFIERLDNADLKGYIYQLLDMGICVLDFRCDGEYLRREFKLRNKDNITWDAEEAFKHFVKVLLKRYIQNETRRLSEEYLNTQTDDVERRRTLLQQKREIVKIIETQSRAIEFAA